ncbi:hypothetical protein OSB04_001730 [Centaurea solstitialis]|uniref:Uncharacterized protein n=1 Tax=Centaurea solstitialis TaxID=347529 RepID=A0AA38TTC2_9ASTR|nr:hypothetical protein OSB04_001730 [Centaurea solstitialis]
MRSEDVLRESGKITVRDPRLISLDLEAHDALSVESQGISNQIVLSYRKIQLESGANKSGNKKKSRRLKGRSYVMTAVEAKDIPDAVFGIVHIRYVSTTLLHYLNRKMEQLEISFIVEITDESQREIVEIIEVYTIIVCGKEFLAKMIAMCFGRFDVVLGMDCLSENDAQIVCNKKMVKVQTPTGKFNYVRRYRKKYEIGIISMLKAAK